MATLNDTDRHVLVELKHSDAIFASALTFDSEPTKPMAKNLLKNIPSCTLDQEFGAVEIPALLKPDFSEAFSFDAFDLNMGESVSEDHKESTYLARATVPEKKIKAFEKEAKADPSVKRVFADPVIEEADIAERTDAEVIAATPQICPGSPPLGTDRHVAARIGVPWLRRRRMDGRGVYMAIVDTGINVAHLRSRGKRPILDARRSWMARPGDRPGRLPVGHGTMVAYDTMIAAPRATLLDIALLRSTRRGGSVMAGLLSDAIRAYVHLYRLIRGPRRPGAYPSLVVNNSWGMFHRSWDFPVGHPGRYQDNPAHPFNRIVGVLAHAGADILFAAGNCGRECPDGRCRGVTNAGIFGANSHPQVISVAGVDVLKRRVGYSTSGPGRLMYLKPDVCGYTHFRGSGVYAADGGTSAAAPVVAGLIGAFRSRFPYRANDFRTSPAAIRNLLTRTAEDRGSVGFDFDYGWGIANGRRLALLRSLSVMQAEDEAATSIDEFKDVEAILDRIEGLDEIEPSFEEAEYAEPMAEAVEADELDFAETEQMEGPVVTGYEGEKPLPSKRKTRSKKSAPKAKVGVPEDGKGAELH